MESETKLFEAIRENDPEDVKKALAEGANPNARSEGQTALYWATFGGNGEIVRALLEAGAKVAEELSDESTSLHAAVEDGNRETVALLLEGDGRAALNSFDYIDRTPLMCAVEMGRLDLVRALLEAGANVNAHCEPRAGNAALHIAAANGGAAMARELLAAGADLLLPGWMRLTPLDKARGRKRPEGRRIVEMMENALKRKRIPERRR
jgi:ankyrin repeat protein